MLDAASPRPLPGLRYHVDRDNRQDYGTLQVGDNRRLPATLINDKR
jgi:hypothetical protein